MGKTKISVVVASYNSKETIEACLVSLLNQKTSVPFEIIVVDSSEDGTQELVRKKFPNIRMRHYGERKFPGAARNKGISIADSEIIAFIDSDCEARMNWIDEIAKAHRSPCPAIGGTIANRAPANLTAWAAYFCEFNQWIPNQDEKWIPDFPAANISYKKEVLDKIGPFMEGVYCSDTDLHWRLGKCGLRIRFVPSITIAHRSIEKLNKFLKHEFFHGQSFARLRIRLENFSNFRKFLYVAFSPLIPVKLFLRAGYISLRSKTYVTEFLKSSPLLMLGLLCWTLGEISVYSSLRSSTVK